MSSKNRITTILTKKDKSVPGHEPGPLTTECRRCAACATSAQCYEQFTAVTYGRKVLQYCKTLLRLQSHLVAKICVQIYVAASGIWRTAYGV